MNQTLILILALVCAIMSVGFRGIYAAVGRVGKYEIKKKAQLRRPGAKTLYLLHQRSFEALIGLTIWQMVTTAIFIIMLIQLMPAWASVIVATLVLTLGGEVIGSFYLQNILKSKLDYIWPLLDRLLAIVRPVSAPIGKSLQKKFGDKLPYVYSREHLLAILESSKSSELSDIKNDDTKLVKAVLEFGGKQIRKVMVPIAEFPKLQRNTEIGPIVLDEMYKTNYSSFPVCETEQDHIIGVVSLHKLTALKAGGKAGDVTNQFVPYVSEELPLSIILEIYEKTHEVAYLVTNRFDDVVGLITLEEVINQLTGYESGPIETQETMVE